MAPKYKLTYFDLKGRAELSRMIFAAADVEYEDCRISFADWPPLKATVPFYQLPVLEVDGKKYAQSFAIANYLANEFGFRGENNEENLQIDQILELIKDFIFYMNKSFKEPDADTKAEYMKEAMYVHSLTYLKYLEKMIEKQESRFFVGSKLTLADLAVFDIMDLISDKNPDAMEGFPALKVFRDKVNHFGRLQKYLEQRKK